MTPIVHNRKMVMYGMDSLMMIWQMVNDGKSPVKLFCKEQPDQLVRKCKFGK